VAWSLLVYGFVVRGAVAALNLVATTLRLGSHYDVSALVYIENPITGHWHHFDSGSLEQLFFLSIVPQLAIWPIYTVAMGMLGAFAALLLVPRGLGRVPLVGAGVGMAPAQPER